MHKEHQPVIAPLGKVIESCRNAKRLTLEKLANNSRLTMGSVHLIEKEKRDPKVSTIYSLASGLNIPLSAFALMGEIMVKLELTSLDAEAIELIAEEVSIAHSKILRLLNR